ncbi:hypothetical protein HOLleu_24875 [Holothuria leucospilota]|uniref:Ig-like domain-containing protein n=1 Tax=Holothuria leucospilota TaxID=206669 RepID=A0A9Q1BS31_HOLLE|nr:hypothetical protein HOLleu_24875 [Holothuria leucospilota]
MCSYDIFVIRSFTFVMLMQSDILFLMCCYVCLTLVRSKSDCKKMYQYRVPLAESKNLTCTMRTTCSRGLWRRDTENKWFLQGRCTDCGDNFAVTTNLPRGLNILHVSNVSENDADIYYCECEYTSYKSNDTFRDIVACFNLTTYQRPDCQLSVGVNGEIFRFYGYNNDEKKKKINVTVNDNVQMNCSHVGKTDCSYLENNGGIVRNQYQERCMFTCVNSKDNMTCKIRLILHSLPPNSLNSSETSPQRQGITLFTTWFTTTSKKSSTATPQDFTSTKLTSFPTPDSSTVFSTDDMQSTEYQPFTSDAETSTILFESTRLLNVPSATIVDTTILTGVSRSAFTQVYITSYRSLATSNTNVTTPNDSSTSVMIISCVILLTSIIAVLFCIHIFCLRIYVDKEEWVNHIYESANNDIQLQGVIQISSNQYEDGGAVLIGACSASSSLKMSTLSLKQINYKSESKRGTTMACEATFCDPMDTLGHGVTSFSEDFIESTKTGCSQDDKFHSVQDSNSEAIGPSNLCLATTATSNASDRPTSPHFYEVVQKFTN